jgi:4-diphosphocytidyl-2-C-methyl-D-erythritol kinase
VSESVESVRVPDRVAAPAKINLFLRVLGRRPDGYHDLETLILPIGLADHLQFDAGAGPSSRSLSLSLEVEGPPELTRDVPVDDSNLVLRAANALADRAGVRGFAAITLEKAVPSAAGLGGGSSDAAATLRVLNELWRCGLDDDQLRAVGAEVGSDVPALVGGEPAIARGRGERVEPATVPRLTWLLVTFDFAVATRDAFDWWDQDGAATGQDPAELIAVATQAHDHDDPTIRGALAARVFNDLQEPVVRRHPVVGTALSRLREAGADAAILSGSGPSVVGLFLQGLADADRNRRLRDDLQELTGRRPIWVVSRAGGLRTR